MELIGETRVCTVCGKEKDLSLFRKIRKKPDGTYYYKHICSSCAGKRYYYKHKKRNDKSFQVSYGNHSKESILKEIQKCVCLCANCHRKVHASKIELEVC